jgi:hypothetical protein
VARRRAWLQVLLGAEPEQDGLLLSYEKGVWLVRGRYD